MMPPKLNSMGTRFLLKHNLEKSKTDVKIFLKSLIVCKKFMNVARSHPVYTLCIVNEWGSEFTAYFGEAIDSSAFKGFSRLCKSKLSKSLSYEYILELIKRLKPKHFCVYLKYYKMSSELTEQLKTMFGLIQNGRIKKHYITSYLFLGKIGLDLCGSHFGYSPLLHSVAVRLNVLKCEISALKEANVESSLNLDYYECYSTLNKGNELAIADLSFDQSDVNSSLQQLTFGWSSNPYESLLPFFGFVKHHCPNLRSLFIYVPLNDDEQYPEDEAMNTVLNKVSTMNETSKRLRECGESMSLSSLNVFMHLKFKVSYGLAQDCKWFEKLKQLDGFNNLVIKKCHNYGCQFSCKSNDGFFTLIHQIEIEPYSANDDHDNFNGSDSD